MRYKHTAWSKVYIFIIITFLAGLILFVDKWGFKLIFIVTTLIMFKEMMRMFTAEYWVDEQGYHTKDIFSQKQIADWHTLEYITITKRNRKWVALVSGDDIHYIKNDMIDREDLLKEMIKYARKNKSLAIHDTINEKFNLKLRLNDEGRIISKKSK